MTRIPSFDQSHPSGGTKGFDLRPPSTAWERVVVSPSQSQREFEAHRKRCQALFNSMTMTLADAVQEGERRATTILSRLAAKVRSGQTKKPKQTRKGF